ncbi:MAG: DNA polymerase I, partial [Candidatus Pelagibacter sp.]|nr:DNA polymerase I [Candidatus Pelagibacter sp.]
MKSIKELVLVDGSGFIFRAYYALPPMTRSDGTPVNAVFGFCNMLLKLLEKVQMEKGGEVAVAVIFDAARKTFRNEIYSEYKANRSDPPEDLIPQFKIIKDVPESFNLKSIQVLGFEADDLIASYAKIAQEKNIKITIVSSDKDLMQLLNENILMLDPMKNIEIRDKHVFEKFGVYPKQVIDVQSLAGDSSDNVPGVPGIGIKTAALLINEYGSLENLLENCEKIKQNKRRESISNNKDLAIISKKLVTLKDDVQLPIPIEDLSFQPLDKVKLINFLEDMEFSRIKSQVIAKFGDISSGEIQNKKEKKKLGSGIIDAEESQVQMEKYELVCDESQLQTWINRAYEIGRVAIDTETDSLSATEAKIVGLSMSFENSEACYVPINHVNKDNNFSQIGIDSFVKIIKPLMEDNSILKIGQNIKYDYIILNNLGIKINNVDDTMLMSYVLFAGKHKHGLDDLSRIYLNHNVISFTSLTKIGRERKKFEEIDINDAKKYACEDSDVTHRLWSKFKKELIKQKLYSFYFYIERPLINVIAEMEIIGIKVDFNVLETLAEKFETELNLIEKKIFSISNQTFNIASPKQLGDVLFNELKLPFGKKGKSGNYQTDVNILEKLK